MPNRHSAPIRDDGSADGLLIRARLFALLDEGLSRPLTWVSAPAGAGKSALLKSYLAARSLPTIRHEADADDADLGIFFRKLGNRLPHRRARLPAFGEEFRSDLAAYARRYWGRFFASLADGTALLLDGLPDWPETTAGVLIREATRAIPGSMRLFVLTRDRPPRELSELQVKGQVTLIDPDSMRFDIEETRGLARDLPDFTAAHAEELQTTTGGWAAAIRMVIEDCRRTGRLRLAVSASDRDALFGYLAAEVYDRMPAPTREALLRTCMLPRISPPLVESLGLGVEGWRVLAELAERRMFIDATEGASPALRLHTLFRDFLVARARRDLGHSGFSALQARAAAVLSARGENEAAIPLYAASGDWVTAAHLILIDAAKLLARGQSRTLRGWVQALPSWYVESTPRLLYCLGLAQAVSAPVEARRSLSLAYRRFVAEGHLLGQALAAAAVVQTFYFEFDAVTDLDPWIDSLHALVTGDLTFPSIESELHTCSMLQIAMTWRQPDHPYLPACAERVLGLLSRCDDANQVICAATLLLGHCDWFDPDTARLLAGFIRPRLRDAGLTEFNRLWWLLAEANHELLLGQWERAHSLIVELRGIVGERGILPNPVLLTTLSVLDPAVEAPLPARQEASMLACRPDRRQELQNRANALIPLALRRGDVSRARMHAEQALRVAQEIGHRTCELEALGWMATVAIETDRCGDALDFIAQARRLVGGNCGERLEYHHLLLEARAMLHAEHRSDAADRLRRAFGIARRFGFEDGFQWVPRILSELCHEALLQGIEAPYVRQLIRSRNLPPPTDAIEDDWPWRVRIRVLGTFSVEVDGTLLRFEGKAQKRPIELLYALVAAGVQDVAQDLLVQELWPDSEGDAARSALRMAVHRLRKLLGEDRVLQVRENRVGLDAEICWVDAWALEDLCCRIESTPAGDWGKNAQRLLELNSGTAFDVDAAFPSLLHARNRWRGRFLQAVVRIGKALEAREDWDGALALYARGLDADPLAEDLYACTMACHLRRGSPAEAFVTYRRCQTTLSVALGVAPSARIESVRQQIVAHLETPR